MTFTFTDLHVEPGQRPDPYDIILGAVAAFAIVVEERQLYREDDLPVVELAMALRRWLNGPFLSHEPFEYQSMESDEDGMVWIRPEQDGWRIGSIYQEFADPTVRSNEDVATATRAFIEEVEQGLLSLTGKRIPVVA